MKKRDWSCGIGDEPEGEVSTTSGPLYDKTWGKIPIKFRGWAFGGLIAGGVGLAYWFGAREARPRHY